MAFNVENADCLDVLRSLPDACVDAVVTDPPANIKFMGRDWDFFGENFDPAFGAWLAGFTDGEGCFRIHKQKEGGYYACHFQIKLRRDDRHILEQIRDYLGVGRVFDIAASEANGRDAKPAAEYIVDKREDCLKIREFFDRFPLRAKKARDYAIWARALDAWLARERGNRWHGPGDNGPMEALWLEMRSVREYVDTPHVIAPSRYSTGNPFRDFLGHVFRECLRVLKPGGHALVWALPRTSHWTGAALEDAGFEVRDVITHIFGSGMPKSNKSGGPGTGTGLKPASEHWILTRKPLIGTIAKNVAEFGTGAMNIDGCRIEHASPEDFAKHKAGVDAIKARGGSMDHSWKNSSDLSGANEVTTLGRWPANIVLSHGEDCEKRPCTTADAHCAAGACPTCAEDPIGCAPDCPVAMLDAQSGDRPGMSGGGRHRPDATPGVFGAIDCTHTARGDSGGCSRFFYVAKPSTREREAGCGHLPRKSAGELVDREEGSAGIDNPRAGAGRTSKGRANHHPTVKSIALMRWLVRLILPPGGIVLDPFCGSGTTGCAVVLGGGHFVGIDMDAEYVEIARARIGHWVGEVYDD